jgi:hypothetical protein
MPIALAKVCFEEKSGSGADLLPCRSLTRKRHSRYAKVATFFRSIPRQRRGSSDSCLKLIPLRGRAAATLQHGTYLAVPYPGLDSIVPFTA